MSGENPPVGDRERASLAIDLILISPIYFGKIFPGVTDKQAICA